MLQDACATSAPAHSDNRWTQPYRQWVVRIAEEQIIILPLGGWVGYHERGEEGAGSGDATTLVQRQLNRSNDREGRLTAKMAACLTCLIDFFVVSRGVEVCA